MRWVLFWRNNTSAQQHNCDRMQSCWQPPGGTCDTRWQSEGVWRMVWEGGRIIGLPFLGELWGEVGGEESWEEALDTVSSGCLRCLSFPSSDRDRIFFRDWGELVPVDMCEKMSRISMRNAAIPPRGCWDAKLHCLGFLFNLFACCQTACRWQHCPEGAGGSADVYTKQDEEEKTWRVAGQVNRRASAHSVSSGLKQFIDSQISKCVFFQSTRVLWLQTFPDTFAIICIIGKHYLELMKVNFWPTKRRQILDWHFLAGWVEGHGGDLQGLVPFGQLAPLLAGSSGHDRGGVWSLPTGILGHWVGEKERAS